MRITERRACGQRRTYQAGCRCVKCRAANADYMQGLRLQRARGETPDGAYVRASLLWRQIDRLTAEGFTLGVIARRLGLKRPRLELHHRVVRQRSVQRVGTFYDAIMAEGPDLNNLF